MTEPLESYEDAGGIRCRDAAYLVCDARDRTLLPDEQASLTAHLAVCPHCKIANRQFRLLFAQIDELLGNSRPGADL